jgi:hypothetical protein
MLWCWIPLKFLKRRSFVVVYAQPWLMLLAIHIFITQPKFPTRCFHKYIRLERFLIQILSWVEIVPCWTYCAALIPSQCLQFRLVDEQDIDGWYLAEALTRPEISIITYPTIHSSAHAASKGTDTSLARFEIAYHGLLVPINIWFNDRVLEYVWILSPKKALILMLVYSAILWYYRLTTRLASLRTINSWQDRWRFCDSNRNLGFFSRNAENHMENYTHNQWK